jgi:hypothetical protein
MNCTKCGSTVKPGGKYCSSCGAPAGVQYCPGCGKQLTMDTNFCPNCGKKLLVHVNRPASVAPATTPTTSAPAAFPTAEAVIMDTGAFPIAYIENLMSSINGKLSLTRHYLVFKASKLLVAGGMAAGDQLNPNPTNAIKSTEYFSIPLSAVTAVEKGRSHIAVQAYGQKYKFRAMTKTVEWKDAINNTRAQD